MRKSGAHYLSTTFKSPNADFKRSVASKVSKKRVNLPSEPMYKRIDFRTRQITVLNISLSTFHKLVYHQLKLKLNSKYLKLWGCVSFNSEIEIGLCNISSKLNKLNRKCWLFINKLTMRCNKGILTMGNLTNNQFINNQSTKVI